MSDTATPGQIAYTAYCLTTFGAAAQPDDYATLTWGQRDAWEAVAAAVLDAWQTQQGEARDAGEDPP